MKKYLFIVILLFSLTYLRINAQNDKLTDILIIEVGEGNESDLELNNSIKTQGEVDFSKIGTYNLTYYNEKYEYFFERTVKIVDCKEIYNGVNYYEEIEKLNKNYKVNDISYITNDEYYIVGEIDSDDEIIQTLFVQKYGFVRYYDNNKLVWEHVFDNTYSYVSSCEVSQAGILLLLSYEKSFSNSDVMIVEMTKNKNIIRSMSFGGNEIEFATHLKLVGNDIVCFLSSYSTYGEISYIYDNSRFLAFVVVGYDDFIIKNKKMYGNDSYNIILDVDYDPVYKDFYLLIRTSGSRGPLKTKDNKYNGDFLVKLSKDIEILNTKHLDTLFASNEFISLARDKILVVSNNTIKNALLFTYYSYNFNYEKSSEFTYNNNIIIPFKIRYFINEDLLIGLNLVKDDVVDSAVLTIYDDDTKINILDGLERLSLISYNDESSIVVSDDNSIKKYINIETITIKKENYNFKDYFQRYVFINNMPAGIVGTREQQKSFGEYQSKSYFNLYNITIILKSEYYEPFITNIKNNEIYDIDLKVCFNGNGLLNDENFISGEKITKPGKYELIIKGENDRKILYFEIKELSLSLKDKENVELNIKEINTSKNNYLKEGALILDVNFNEVSTPVILYFILIISVFIIASLLIPLKFKKSRRKK